MNLRGRTRAWDRSQLETGESSRSHASVPEGEGTPPPSPGAPRPQRSGCPFLPRVGFSVRGSCFWGGGESLPRSRGGSHFGACSGRSRGLSDLGASGPRSRGLSHRGASGRDSRGRSALGSTRPGGVRPSRPSFPARSRPMPGAVRSRSPPSPRGRPSPPSGRVLPTGSRLSPAVGLSPFHQRPSAPGWYRLVTGTRPACLPRPTVRSANPGGSRREPRIRSSNLVGGRYPAGGSDL